MSCDCLWSVSFPHDVVGWSAVCDCGISWSYLLATVYDLGQKRDGLSSDTFANHRGLNRFVRF